MVELLAVIAIIGIIAAMVVGLTSLAARKKHDAAATAMKNRLMLFISTYQSKMGFYPPDNANNVILAAGTPAYEQSTGINPLIYELTGAPMTPADTFVAYDSSATAPDIISSATFSAAYGRGGIANSLPDETHVFFQPLPAPGDYIIFPNGLKQLVSPVPLTGAANETNLWHYDSSSTNRHNSSTYDLWTEYSIGKDGSGNTIIFTNGNW